MKKNRLLLLLCVIFLSCSLSACSKTNEAPPTAESSEEVKKETLEEDKKIAFEDFSSEISGDKLIERINVLAAHDDARMAGTDGEAAAAEYIKKEFESVGLQVEEQPFPYYDVFCTADTLTEITADNKSIKCTTLSDCTTTPAEGIVGNVAISKTGTIDDIKAMDLSGKILLSKKTRDIDYDLLMEEISKTGAIGAVFYMNKLEEAPDIHRDEEIPLPSMQIGSKDAFQIIKKVENNETVSLKMLVQNNIIDSTCKNIIGTLKSKKADAKTILVGAHYDCVETPGANDNASGTSAIIEAAKVLSQKNLNCNIKFIAFAAEEHGIFGSEYYASNMTPDEKENTICMVNADMVAVGDTLYLCNAPHDTSATTNLIYKCSEDLNYTYKKVETQRGDNESFDKAGVPFVYVYYGEDENYHTDEDSIDKINKDNLIKSCNVITSFCYGISENQ